MSKLINLTGKKFGRLLVISRAGTNCKNGNSTWNCVCDCGNECVVDSQQLKNGKTTSCGCYNKEVVRKLKKKYNEYETFGNITFVKFSNCNEYFICDTEDWNKLKDICWYKNNGGYAVNKNGEATMFFHRMIMNCPNNKVVDHKYQVSNGVCDNRKSNLKICTQQENVRNSKIGKNNKSGKTGVCFKNKKWVATITINRKQIYLGQYDNKNDAIEARTKAEIKYGFCKNSLQ